jgi:hypothetical protein
MCICWHFREKRLGIIHTDELVATDDPTERTALLPKSNNREEENEN